MKIQMYGLPLDKIIQSNYFQVKRTRQDNILQPNRIKMNQLYSKSVAHKYMKKPPN